MSLHSETLPVSWFRANPSLLLLLKTAITTFIVFGLAWLGFEPTIYYTFIVFGLAWLGLEPTIYYTFIVFGLTWLGLEPTIYYTHAKRANHYTTVKIIEVKG
jgi:hypothetical protein